MGRALLGLMALLASGCISPSVLDESARAVDLGDASVAWAPAAAEHVPGTYVSTELEGQVAVVLRKLVYSFGRDGDYTGAGLFDDDPPHFEVLTGTWSFGPEGLSLDGGPHATLEVAPDGSLRLTGDEGRVVLRREVER